MKYALWLSNIPKMTRAKQMSLYEAGISAEEFYGYGRKQLLSLSFITEEIALSVEESKASWDLDGNAYRLCERGIFFVSQEQSGFPERLRQIPAAPYALYYKGTLPDPGRRSVAIVGARGRSEYGRQAAQELAGKLSGHGVQIISGLAWGIDTDSHKGALGGSTPTYAVLGCGVDICYPKANRYLYDQILAEKGGILSEYLPGQAPLARLFPFRNRIISGLSDAVIVVEAREKSGSLITADFANDQGRDIYAVPGRICDALSAGCNRLIAQGAGAVWDLDEFVRTICEIEPEKIAAIDFRKNLLEKDERMLYSLFDFRPLGIGTLMEESGMNLSALLAALGRLEEKGFIREAFPNYFVRDLSSGR